MASHRDSEDGFDLEAFAQDFTRMVRIQNRTIQGAAATKQALLETATALLGDDVAQSLMQDAESSNRIATQRVTSAPPTPRMMKGQPLTWTHGSDPSIITNLVGDWRAVPKLDREKVESNLRGSARQGNEEWKCGGRAEASGRKIEQSGSGLIVHVTDKMVWILLDKNWKIVMKYKTKATLI